MTDSKSRFESWAVDVKGWNLEQWEDDRYKYHHDAWLAWQACEAQSAARIAKLEKELLDCAGENGVLRGQIKTLTEFHEAQGK